ncbi:MAG: DNA polymerase IV [Polyangiales bacterium]
MTRERIILHADMDAFFASIEERDQPELRGKPVIVGAVSARGVVAAASYAARQFGVRSAMPGFRARELCPHGIYLPSDIKKYARVSAQVHEVFEEFTPQIEPLALDEAFLDITGSVHRYGSARELAQALKRRVREATELTVSCGIAPNKLVAKLACSLGKPDGLYLVEAHEVRPLLDPLPIRRLFGVGPVTEQALVEAGFRTFADVAAASVEQLSPLVGERAREVIALAQGDDDRPVVADRAPKSYGEENTFEEDQRAGEAITNALTTHAHAIARRLRRDETVGRTITLKLRLARRQGQSRARVPVSDDPARSGFGQEAPRYPMRTRSRSLERPTDDAALIRRVALELYESSGIHEPVRLVGIAVSNLGPVSSQQLDLFSPAERRSAKLGPALDQIRARFGDGAISVASHAPEKLTPSSRKKRGE